MPQRYQPRHTGPIPVIREPILDDPVVGVAEPAVAEPVEQAVETAVEPVRAPGLAAALRRHPSLPRRAGAAAVLVGVVTFGVAQSASASFSGQLRDRIAAARAAQAPAPAPAVESGFDITAALPPAPVAPAAKKALTRKPVKARKKAPATPAIISGLAANGIPNVALNAYRVAAARVDHANPGCGIDWALLAGIGRQESDHGRFAGAVLRADGTSTPRIMGPALDGVKWDYIPAPPNGLALYGDGKYAHALGPMQFIPTTWSAYGADANGDGRADVFNINDAALGAARYLCAAGGNLRTAAGQVAAVLAYNHNDEYLAQVLALANFYRKGISLTGVPVGNTTGALPPIDYSGYIPPVNPGAPTAVGKTTTKKTTAKKTTTKKTTTRKTSSPAPAKSTGTTAGGTTSGGTSGGTTSGGTSGGTTAGGTTSGGTSGGTTSGGTASSPAPAPSGSTSTTTAPSPSPSPTKSCIPLNHLLGLC